MTEDRLKYVASLYGGFWNFDIKDFSYLVNPYFPPKSFMLSLGSRLEDLVRSYPSTNWHISSLMAKTLGLSHEELVIANGASELIDSISSRYISTLAVPIPTFDEYINRAVNQGKQVSMYHTPVGVQLDVDEFIKHVLDDGANSALVVNPNNPTGELLPVGSILKILDSLKHLDLIIVDESFLDFAQTDSDPSVIDSIHDYSNLVVLKSLSKTSGIPGLRLGYAVSGNKDMVKQIRADLPIWSINSMAQYFLEEIEKYLPEFAGSCKMVAEATEVLYQGLSTIPFIKVYPTNANFVLCEVVSDTTAEELASDLFNQFNMIVNNQSKKTGLNGEFVRIASRTKEENLQIIDALRKLSLGYSTTIIDNEDSRVKL